MTGTVECYRNEWFSRGADVLVGMVVALALSHALNATDEGAADLQGDG